MRTPTVADVMTRDVVYLPGETSLTDTARAMRDHHIGTVLVTDGTTLAGVVTDRDIVVRAVAERRDPATTPVRAIVTEEIVMVEQGAPADDAATIMRANAVRRLLVCDEERQLVGVVSLGDLAVRLDPTSALGDISSAAPNN